MGKFGRFANGTAVQQAKFENQVKAEIENQVHKMEMKLRDEYAEKYEKRLRTLSDAVRKTYEQYQADTAVIALNNLGWGKTRINRFLESWSKAYTTYQQALTLMAEADYQRESLDAKLKAIFTDETVPRFEERYEFLPDINYNINDINYNINYNINKEESEDDKQNGKQERA